MYRKRRKKWAKQPPRSRRAGTAKRSAPIFYRARADRIFFSLRCLRASFTAPLRQAVKIQVVTPCPTTTTTKKRTCCFYFITIHSLYFGGEAMLMCRASLDPRNWSSEVCRAEGLKALNTRPHTFPERIEEQDRLTMVSLLIGLRACTL